MSLFVLYKGAEEHNLYVVAQVVKCSHPNEDITMSKCLWKLLEFYRCPVEHVLHSLALYFTFQVSRKTSIEYGVSVTCQCYVLLCIKLMYLKWQETWNCFIKLVKTDYRK